MPKVRLSYDGWLALPGAGRQKLGLSTGHQLQRSPTPGTPEAAVLLAAARAEIVGPALRKAIPQEPDWTALIGMALHHGTAGLLCRRALDAAGDVMPDELRTAMGTYLESCAE